MFEAVKVISKQEGYVTKKLAFKLDGPPRERFLKAI